MNSSGLATISSEQAKPKLGIIGGSGLCSFPEIEVVARVKPSTNYGEPSDDILLCRHAGEYIALLPRHGSKHAFAPHKVPYKANLSALKALGVEYVIGTCIVGSLKKELPPGSLVIPDQFVNLTWGRDDTVAADAGRFVHLPMGNPYCQHLREKITEAAREIGQELITEGTVAVIQGPRFSTAAESRWLAKQGWDVVNMTQYPECYFARELGMCYAAIAAVTDYDVGLQESLTIDPRHMEGILEIFRMDILKTKALLLSFIEHQAARLACGCANLTLKAYYEHNL